MRGMTEEQRGKVIAEVLQNLKMDDDREEEAGRYVDRVADQILIFCNRSDFPDQLLRTAAMITEDLLRADQVVEGPKDVGSVSRGDTSITYRDNQSLIEGARAFMKVYERTLVHFKKMNLPKGDDE